MLEFSRIIVKNLPKYITQDQVKDHFCEKGAITDVKLISTTTGVFRRFAYIGFRTEKEARAAINYFHNTFVDTAKIHVELARPVGDPNLPRAWSKYTSHQSAKAGAPVISSADVSEKQTAAKKSYIDSLYEEEQKRESISSYLHVLQSRATKSTWQNDDGISSTTPQQGPETKPALLKKGNVTTLAVPNRKPGGEGLLVQRTKITFDSDDSSDEYQTIPSTGMFNNSNTGSSNDVAVNSQDGPNPTSPQKSSFDSETMANTSQTSRTVNTLKQPIPAEPTNVSVKSKVVPRTTEDISADTKVIQDTCRLFLVNLPYSALEEDVIRLCQPHGAISNVHIPVHNETKQSKGVAFVTYVTVADALLAYKMLQGQFFMGRRIHVRGAEAVPKQDPITDPSQSSFKARKLAQRNSTAQSGFNWNAMFMASDAVASAMASKLGVSKSEILDRESDDMAVRLALSETHVIAETKQYLSEHGVVLDSFDRNLRSDTVILVKNITHGTTVDEIVALVQPFGDVGRVLLPPSGIIALAEFLAASDASKAFRSLAYRRFKSLPLYLEWAPKDCFNVPYNPDVHSAGTYGVQPFAKASEPVLPKSNKRVQSAAFLGEDLIDETKLLSSADSSNSKLIVRNVPFEATIKDLRQLFQPFAHVKSLRLPKKVTGGHRGFAFAEFLTHGEAVEALRTLKHTHLYGRRMVIEFAKKGDNVEELQEKTRASLMNRSGKRARVDMGKFDVDEDDSGRDEE